MIGEPKNKHKVTALAGGVGGAKLADGLAQLLGENLTIIVNTGDDFEMFGLKICPDLDTVCYTLAGIANPESGWGRKDETWNAIENIKLLGGPTWFNLGDRDLATHLERTRRIKEGEPLSQITHYFNNIWNISAKILPMTDDPVFTQVITDEGEMAFQEYFVKRRCEPSVKGFHFSGASNAKPAPGVLEALQEADLILFCPSNPWVSIDPILSIPGSRDVIKNHVVVAVSPIIGGKAVKGPVVKMYSELGIQPNALSVALHYGARESGGLLTGFMIDKIDALMLPELYSSGFHPSDKDIIMRSPDDRRRLAEEVLEFGWSLTHRG
jgi:LPPG:FO 2-phospho-L-lactate transferase